MTWLPEGTTPLPGDNAQRSLWKIVDLLGSSGASGALRTTEEGDTRITEEGEIRIQE